MALKKGAYTGQRSDIAERLLGGEVVMKEGRDDCDRNCVNVGRPWDEAPRAS